MTVQTTPTGALDSPLLPSLYRVAGRRRETGDVVTLMVEPADGAAGGVMGFECGQFNMLTAFGVGEVAISISSSPGEPLLLHTIRDVGAVSHALCELPVGAALGVRGPFGRGWGEGRAAENAAGSAAGSASGSAAGDTVVVAGGIGLAPLRGAVEHLVGAAAGRVVLLVGARSPDQLIFGDDLDRWQRAGAEVQVTVDVADRIWRGHVGVVTLLVAAAEIDPARTSALVCGPEVMIRYAARALLDKGVPAGRVRVSLERNMQCGIGLCGHCQLGPLLLCRDGPVVPFDASVSELMSERER